MPACGVPGQHHRVRIDEPADSLSDQPWQPVDRHRDVVERPRPAAADLARPTVLRRYDNEPGRCQSLRERGRVLATVSGPPEPSMQDHCQQISTVAASRFRLTSLRQMYIGHLIGLVAVADHEVGRPGGPGQHVAVISHVRMPILGAHLTGIRYSSVMFPLAPDRNRVGTHG